MNKYKLNILRWLTRGQVPDDILKKSFNHRVEDGKFTFNFKANVDTSQWRGCYGSAK
ncbi:unnamed protein product [marine sediment metagenome]|uniref:Uncharacterized protein n=1 Tax=marine sediment metagenome TaxID=412755 RepID=X0RNU3_9ZZZZ